MLLLLLASKYTNKLLDYASKDHCFKDHCFKDQKVDSGRGGVNQQSNNKNNNGE